MPARAGEAVQHRSPSGFLVEMHRLRIEFPGKRQNFLARDAARSECADTARRKIFEGQRHLVQLRQEARFWPHFEAITTRPAAWLVPHSARNDIRSEGCVYTGLDTTHD